MKANYYYDATNQRSLLVENSTEGSAEFLRLFKEKTEYVYDVKTQKCEKRPINEPWQNFGVPPTAEYKGNVYYGSSAVAGANLQAQVFELIVDNQGKRLIYNGCK